MLQRLARIRNRANRTFGDFEFQRAGFDMAVREQAAEQFLELRVMQLPPRDIDADEQRRIEREEILPIGEIVACAFERETAERNDKPACLRMRDEIGRRDDALHGMMPAQQRLEARNRTVTQTDDRLIEYIEL